jgi:hypothetical protein
MLRRARRLIVSLDRYHLLRSNYQHNIDLVDPTESIGWITSG